jgi:hypothetical protein
MATSISPWFSPIAISCSNTRNRRYRVPARTKSKPPQNPKLNSHNSPSQPPLLSAGDAITYTRLPLKEDYSSPLSPSSSEIKLSESTPIHQFLYKLKHNEEEEEEINANFEIIVDSDSDSEEEEDEELGFIDDEDDEEDEEINEGEELWSEETEGEVKEKGLPAVMRCFDRAKIYAKAGDGGNGSMAFRREKYVPFGGPSGGDGGRGGNVYVEVDRGMNSLLPFRNGIHFRAGRGSHGAGRMKFGAKGEDVVVKVPPGTVVREADKDEVLLEMVYHGQKSLLLPGGRGGRGNAAFKSGTNKAPKIAENGEEGPEMYVSEFSFPLCCQCLYTLIYVMCHFDEMF